MCFHCGKEIELLGYKQVALDKPYVNLYFHKSCLLDLDLEPYIYENIGKIFKYIEEMNEKR